MHFEFFWVKERVRRSQTRSDTPLDLLYSQFNEEGLLPILSLVFRWIFISTCFKVARGIVLSNRRIEVAIGGFLVLLFLSLIGWNVALYYNFRIQTINGILIAIFGFYLIGIILMPDDK